MTFSLLKPGKERRACVAQVAIGACCLLALLLLPASSDARPLCLYLEAGGRNLMAIPATPGSELRLAFLHSIYGAAVEELFHVRRDGFQLARLLYAEPRLVEFYGHEAARHEKGWWVVTPERRSFRALDLRASPDAFMRISLNSEPIPLHELVEPGEAVRVTVASCARI